MQSLRASIREHCHLALALLVGAFFIRAVIPAGFMVSTASDTVLKAPHSAFSSLAKVADGAADALLLALAFAFILVLGLAPVQRVAFRRPPYLRPPLRGPPAAA